MLSIRLNRTFILLVAVFLVFFTLAPLSHEADDGEKIVFVSTRDGNEEIYVMNVDGSNVVQLTHNSAADLGPAWSPDGKKIAFVSDREGNSEIYIMNADGSNVVKLLPDNIAENLNPAWSPDGKKIAFNSNMDGSPEIYVMNADGSNLVQLTHDKSWSGGPAWSPDGQRIAYSAIDLSDVFSTGGFPSQIRVIDADGGNMVKFGKNDDSSPVWSPDGEKIVFSSFRNGNYEIYVMNADGTEEKRLTTNPRIDKMPVWSPDGEKIAFVSDRDGNDEIYIMNADGSNVVRLTENSYRDYGPDWCSQHVREVPSSAESVPVLDFWFGTLLIAVFLVGLVFLSKKKRNWLKILIIVVIVVLLGLRFSFLDISDVDIPHSREATAPPPVDTTPPDVTQLGIVWIKIEYELHGTHGFLYKYFITRHSDGNYYLDEVSGFHDQSIDAGQKIDTELIQELADSFTDFYPAQKAYYRPQGLDGYASFEIVVKLENEETLSFLSCPFHSWCCGIPWNIEYTDKKYIQVNGEFPSALFRILRHFDEEIDIRFDKQIRWGCYPAVLYFDYYDPLISEDFPRSETVVTPLEELGQSHVVWEADIPPFICPPVYAEGVIYSATERHIIALDAETAETLWDVEIETKEEDNSSTLTDTDSYGSIIVHEGTIYAALPPSVYRLDAKTGDILWEYTADQYTYPKVFMSGNNLIVWGKEKAYEGITCLRAETGDKTWEITGNLYLLDIFDGKVLYKVRRLSGSFDFFYTLVDVDSGDVIWEKDSSEFVMWDSDITNWSYDEGILYFDEEEKGAFAAVDTETMEEQLLYSHEKFTSGYDPGLLLQYCKAFEQGILLYFLEFGEKEWPMSTWSTRIVFLDKTGSVLWEHHYDENSVGFLYSVSFLFIYDLMYNPVEGAEIFQDTLYVWRRGGYIEAYTTNGEKLWESEVRDSIKSFHMYDNRIYVAANDCKLYCLDADTGEILWELVLCDSHCVIHIDETDIHYTHYSCICDHPVYVVESEDGVFLIITEGMLTAVSVEPEQTGCLIQ